MRLSTLAIVFHLAFFLLGAPAFAQREKTLEVNLSPKVELDLAGQSLRDALNAYEADLNSPIPMAWSRLRMANGETVRFSDDLFVVKPEIAPNDPLRIMVVGPDGPAEGTLAQGKEIPIGPLLFLLVSASPDGRNVDALIKAAVPSPVLLHLEEYDSPNKIQVFENPRLVTVTSIDHLILEFSRDYIQGLNKGLTPKESAIAARQRTPPVPPAPPEEPPPGEQNYVDPVNIMQDPALDAPLGVNVTIHMVAGDSSALQELNSRLRYDSAGRSPDKPRVGAAAGPGGGAITVGSPGDKFQSTVHAIEARHQISIQSETNIYVPFGGYTDMDLNGPQGFMSASVSARRVGQNTVELRIYNQNGNWGYYGGINTRIRLRDGQTIPAASNTTTMTSTSQSGAPILQDLPYVGPAFGSTRQSTQASQYCIYIGATIN